MCAVLFFSKNYDYLQINISISRLIANKIKAVYKCCFVMILQGANGMKGEKGDVGLPGAQGPSVSLGMVLW